MTDSQTRVPCLLQESDGSSDSLPKDGECLDLDPFLHLSVTEPASFRGVDSGILPQGSPPHPRPYVYTFLTPVVPGLRFRVERAPTRICGRPTPEILTGTVPDFPGYFLNPDLG